MDLSQFVSEVENFRAGRRRVIWSKAIRKKALGFLDRGVEAEALAQATGITENTFKSWQNPARKELVELAVQDNTASDLLLTIEAKGFSIHAQNLSTAAFIKLLREFL